MESAMRRLTFDEGLRLFQEESLANLRHRAQEVRFFHNRDKATTFVLDSNPNYTNVCVADCSFCAFYRKPGAGDSYTKSVDQVMVHLERARRAGLSTVLLQGGLHPDLQLPYFVELVRSARTRFPDIFPHFFSAPEIDQCAKVTKCTTREVLSALKEAGLRTLPGGGAEILSEPVRRRISPKKLGPGKWIEIHKTAHEVGLKSTATMMYGHVESAPDIIQHLDELRELQDQTAGFTAFIPWSYKRDNTALRRVVKHGAGREHYLRILSTARIYLDNFPHIQATWFSEGKEVGIEALNWGADDFGGTLLEENVHRAANHVQTTHLDEILAMIGQAGYQPLERDPLYAIRRAFQKPPSSSDRKQERFSLSALFQPHKV